MTRLLRSAGWMVAAFESPPTFLEHAATHCFPVAVIDICMPVMDGFEVQTQMRKLSPGTQIVFLTSRDDSSTRERALTSGAFAFLLKPANADELLSIIESAARKKG